MFAYNTIILQFLYSQTLDKCSKKSLLIFNSSGICMIEHIAILKFKSSTSKDQKDLVIDRLRI